MLAQGLSVGIANGFLFCPSFTITSTYFLKKRSIAVGIGACGSVTGGIVFPLMARQLLPKIGFPWTMRAIALVQLFLLLVANVLSKPRVKPRKGGPLIDIKAFKEMEYTFYALGAFLVSFQPQF
jgi:MFS family permease